jgi:hypothetical protein
VPPAMSRAPRPAAANAADSSEALVKLNGNTAAYASRAAFATAVTMLV